jgi:hypothetical protein
MSTPLWIKILCRTVAGPAALALALIAAPPAHADGPAPGPAPTAAAPAPALAAAPAGGPWRSPLAVERRLYAAVEAPFDRRLNPRLTTYADLRRFQRRSLLAYGGGVALTVGTATLAGVAIGADRVGLGVGTLVVGTAPAVALALGGAWGWRWSTHQAWQVAGRRGGVSPGLGLWASRLFLLSIPVNVVGTFVPGLSYAAGAMLTSSTVLVAVTHVQTTRAARELGLLPDDKVALQLHPVALPRADGEGLQPGLGLSARF